MRNAVVVEVTPSGVKLTSRAWPRHNFWSSSTKHIPNDMNELGPKHADRDPLGEFRPLGWHRALLEEVIEGHIPQLHNEGRAWG